MRIHIKLRILLILEMFQQMLFIFIQKRMEKELRVWGHMDDVIPIGHLTCHLIEGVTRRK